MRILAFDTETTGLVTDTAHPLAETNDYPMQLAALLFDYDRIGNTFELMKVPTQGTLFTMMRYANEREPHPKAFEAHDITKGMTERFGASPDEVLPMFAEFMDSADRIVGHNIKYDMDIMRIAYARAGWEGDPFKGRETYDTCWEAMPVCKMPKYRQDLPGEFKLPKLNEAYKFFFGFEFKGAHGAMQDTLACFDVYLALQGKKAGIIL